MLEFCPSAAGPCFVLSRFFNELMESTLTRNGLALRMVFVRTPVPKGTLRRKAD
jgi:hypothetical protein